MKAFQNRREYLQSMLGGLASLYLTQSVTGTETTSQNHKIDAIDIYRYDVNKALHFSYGTWKTRQVTMVKLSAGDTIGWAEMNAGINKPDLNIAKWGKFLLELKGKTISEALDHVVTRRDDWKWGQLELAEICLLDIAGRLQGKPAIELLGLKPNKPIPGLFCILEEDPKKAREQAHISLQHNLKSHCKIKLFGKRELDLELVRTVRDVMGPQAYLTADVNRGYKDWQSIDELAKIMLGLQAVGLNACEDPATLEIPQWVALQKQVGDMAIIPDYILRPAWKMIDEAIPGMGHIYNLHPACMGTLSGTVALARKIQSWNHGVMIGDASLVGPSCSAWQQIAIGLGAVWVEALEKPNDSGAFLQCVKASGIKRTLDGAFALNARPGFGLELDEKKLKACSQDYVRL